MKSNNLIRFCLLLLLFLQLACFGQESKFALGIIVSADKYLYNQINIETANASKTIRPGFGLGMYYSPSEKWQVKLNVLYSDKGYESDYPFRSVDSGAPEKIIFRNNFLDVPLLIGYRVAKLVKFSVLPGVGLVSSFHLNGGIDHQYNNGQITRYEDFNYNSVFIIPVIEVDLLYKVSENVQVGISPYFRYNLSDIIFDNSIYWVSSTGASFNARYNF